MPFPLSITSSSQPEMKILKTLGSLKQERSEGHCLWRVVESCCLFKSVSFKNRNYTDGSFLFLLSLCLCLVKKTAFWVTDPLNKLGRLPLSYWRQLMFAMWKSSLIVATWVHVWSSPSPPPPSFLRRRTLVLRLSLHLLCVVVSVHLGVLPL